ncbi:MAG: hypothetical protein JWN77_1521 [Frankiales bacterium]|jgi:heme O synthase-like polyprenyltransferase|nr:hypothetical protein [Frankiales bacterium]
MSAATTSRTLDVDHALALATLVLGALSLAALGASYVVAAWLGLLTVFLGGWSQLISRTRPERFENVAGATAGAVALAIGLARGGLI